MLHVILYSNERNNECYLAKISMPSMFYTPWQNSPGISSIIIYALRLSKVYIGESSVCVCKYAIARFKERRERNG